jgi:hypothetical protein
MAILTKKHFFRVNRITIPMGGDPYRAYYDFYPKRCPGVVYPPLREGVVDGIGRPIAAPGFPTTVFRWHDAISVPCYQFWLAFTGRFRTATPLNDLVLPDPNSLDTINGFLFHSQWTSALMWKIQLDGGDDAYIAAMNAGGNEMWIRGGATVRITEIGGGPFG